MLEGRHVIGLFMLMLLFSAVFFTLGYVMGRNQYDGQVRASTVPRNAADGVVAIKPDAAAKHSSATSASNGTPTAPADAAPPSSDWEFYNTDKQKETSEHLVPVSPSSVSSGSKTAAGNSGSERSAPSGGDSQRAAPASGGYTLQVMAVRRQSDAFELAKRLQKRKFPAFVLSPQGGKYYRVQVGPYADQKSAEAAKKGLENAGFRAIVKHG
ncbi:MAG TPA: SPOR domain-containing protein [Candidatus Acidoferrum sp.]